MRKISKKLLIGIIALLVLSATAFAAITFSLADETNDASQFAVYADSAPSTIIDYIIENSISADSKDPTYHILELGSSDTPSDLQKLVTSDGFRQYVINANKSSGYSGTMPDTASIEYIYYNATEGNLKKVNADGSTAAATNDEITQAIQKADLCYLSNDASKIFTNGNDITENIKIALSSYATGSQKPLIIDSHNLTQKYIGITSKTMETIATNDFANYGTTYSTYKWPDDKSASEFFDLTDMSSLFLPINGRTAKANSWTKLNDSTYVAKVLTIQNGAADNALTTKIQAGIGAAFVNPDDSLDPSFDVSNTYYVENTSAIYTGYVGRYGTPTAVKFETCDISSAAGLTDLGNPAKYNLTSYDFVIVENGTKGVIFTGYDSAYNSLISAMNSDVHILYSKGLISTSGSGSTSENTASNYKYVYDKVATSTDIARYGYILVTTRIKMSSYAVAVNGYGVKDIADVINAGKFRGIGGNNTDDASNIYTALEIEPAYPINTDLANVFADDSKTAGDNNPVKSFQDPQSYYTPHDGGAGYSKSFAENSLRNSWNFGNNSTMYGDGGFYYLRTDGVLDATSDEISYDGTTSLTDMIEKNDYGTSLTQDNARNIVDYYNWSLSKAKVAHALGVSYDEVRVVHMSSTEFAASKDTLLDSYDMIYFGGDTSAITSNSYLHSIKNGMQFYRMYRHNGDTYSYPTDKNGYVANTTGVLVGNDITDDKLKELKDYVSKGMPVIFDKAVTEAFAKDTEIDPNSNIYDFFTYASGSTFASNNALWNFDNNYTIKLANIDGSYGDTYSGYVTVFAKNTADEYDPDPSDPTKNEKDDIIGVRRILKASGQDSDTFLSSNLEDATVGESSLSKIIKDHQRPRLAVTSMPSMYVEGNKDTWLSSNVLEFTYKINGGTTGNAMIYIDDDGNGRFTEDDPHKPGSDGKITYTLPKDYFGVVYWKIIVEDPVTGCSASTTGCCKVKRVDQEKMVVDLLEITPPMQAVENNKSTLLFCYECQQTRGILRGNRASTVGKYSNDSVTGLTSGFKDMSGSIFSETASGTIGGIDYSDYTYDALTTAISADAVNKCDIPELADKGDSINDFTEDEVQNNQLGVHDHKFGIVKYYENLSLNGKTGLDDWTTNWFDEIKDDYVVNTTIMTTREYERVCALVNSIYNGKSDTDKETIQSEFQTRKTEYQTYYKVMREVINGHDDTSTYTDSKGNVKHYIQASDWSKFVAFLKNAPTDTTSPGLGIYDEDDIQNFKNASANLDAYLLGSDNGASSANTIASKGQTSADLCLKEIKFETDKSIEPTERSYYDLFSLVNTASGIESFYSGYSQRYQIWRNAKVLEIYFKNQYVKYSLLSSVNTKPTGNTVDSIKDNYINLEDTFNCVVIGAAEDFNGDDINRTGCNALLDYINDQGNLILFHDTLTATKGNTANMTKYLSDAFGQNARHQEYYYESYQQIENSFRVTVGGITKTFTVATDTTEVTINGTVGAGSNKSIEALGTLKDGSTQTSSSSTLNATTKKADVYICMSDSGVLRGVKVVETEGGNTSTTVTLTPYLCKGNVSDSAATLKANLWNTNEYYWPPVNTADYATYAGDLKNVKLVVGGAEIELPWKINGEESVTASTASFTVADPTVTSYGAGFTTSTQIDQKIVVKVTDGAGNTASGVDVVFRNTTTGETVSATTVGGEAVYTFSNMEGNGPMHVRAKNPYRDSEYYISPTTGNNCPNTYTLTLRTALRDQKDSGGNMVMPYKYTVLDKNSEDAEYFLHGDHDMRDAIHSAVRSVTDKTSQTNKGIITMYPFTIGSKMKVSNTTAQSYALDIDDPNMTVYYTLGGGTSGTLSSMYAADPHNGVDNYFLYQYGAITYTGAGHSAITGLGRDNNDERRLFINCIVNSARKSTAGPDLRLYDVDSDMSQHDEAGNRTGLWNDYVEVVTDGESDYKYVIEDIADQVDFSFLPTMTTGTTFDHVEIFFDINREASNRNVYNDGEDVKIFESEKSADVDSEILTRITTGRPATDERNRIGLYLDTPDPHLITDGSGNPNLVLKESYFNKAKKAFIVVTVYDNKGNTATKTLRVEYKPELLELN